MLLRSASGSRMAVTLSEPDVVRAQGHILSGYLSRFRAGFDSTVEADPATAAEQLAILASAARSYLPMILNPASGSAFGAADEMARFAQAACRTWATGSPLPGIQIVAEPEDHLPWEMLPLFDWRIRPEASTLGTLITISRAFAGFGALIERRRPGAAESDPVLDTVDGFTVRMFYNANLDGAVDEVAFLRSRAPRVRVEGPYPDVGLEPGAPDMGQQLRDPTLAMAGDGRVPADRMVHVSCHCDTRGLTWDEFSYGFASAGRQLPWLSLYDLIGQISEADPWDVPRAHRHMPLVFLNACATSVTDPAGAVSLLTPFVKNGNRGMIGTAASVPDAVAAAFSRWFYTELFRGRSVAEAIHLARWDLLTSFANPLGLLYTYYGDGNLRALPVVDAVRADPHGGTRYDALDTPAIVAGTPRQGGDHPGLAVGYARTAGRRGTPRRARMAQGDHDHPPRHRHHR